MDYRERWEDGQEALLAALDGFSARTWCSGPGFIESYDADLQTCSIQPAIMGRVQDEEGNYTWIKLPLLVDCPVIFTRGGGFSITLPLEKGNEVMVFFADRCIDAWWSSGQVSPQSEIRFHDLSDGFVLPGPTSKPNALRNVSTNTLQIRSDDGSTYMELTKGAIGNIICPNGINLTAEEGDIVLTAKNVRSVATMTVTDQAPVINHNGATVLNGTVTGVGGGTVMIDAAVEATGEGTFNNHTVGQHTHTQGPDSDGDTEQPTDTPTG